MKSEGSVAGYGDTENPARRLDRGAESGEIVSIIGPNGAGKSTLMKTIFGLLHPREGGIIFDGQDISRLQPYQIVEQECATCRRSPTSSPS